MMGDERPKWPSPFLKIPDDSGSLFKISVAFSGPSATVTIRTGISKPLPSEKMSSLTNLHDRFLRTFSQLKQVNNPSDSLLLIWNQLSADSLKCHVLQPRLHRDSFN